MAPKPVITTKDPAVAHAENLWRRLKNNLIDAQNTIITIIESRAWEPLGYESFSKAWIDLIMSEVTIASELRPHIVYEMFKEGLTGDQIADIVKGVTPDSADELKRQKEHGVPPELATTTVRRHRRKLPSPVGYIHLRIDHQKLLEWRSLARLHGRSVDDIATEAVEAAFDKLA